MLERAGGHAVSRAVLLVTNCAVVYTLEFAVPSGHSRGLAG